MTQIDNRQVAAVRPDPVTTIEKSQPKSQPETVRAVVRTGRSLLYLHERATRKKKAAFYTAVILVSLMVAAPLVERTAGNWVLSELYELAGSSQVKVEVADLSVSLFSLSPSLSIYGLSVAAEGHVAFIERVNVRLDSEWRDLVGEIPRIANATLSNMQLNARVEESGEDNWTLLFNAFSGNGAEVGPMVQLVQLKVSTTELDYLNKHLDQSGLFAFTAEWHASDAGISSMVEATGDINYLPVTLKASLHADKLDRAGEQPVSLSAAATIETLSMSVEGVADDLASLKNGHLDLQFNGRSTGRILDKVGLSVTNTSDVKLLGSFDMNDSGVLSGALEMALDQSSADARFSLETRTGLETNEKARLTASIRAREVYLDTLLRTADEKVQPRRKASARKDAALFSIVPFKGEASWDDLDADIDISIDRLHKGRLLVQNLITDISQESGKTTVKVYSEKIGEGSLTSTLTFSGDEQDIKGSVHAQVKRIPLDDVFSVFDIEEGMANGVVSGDAKFWFDGRSVADLAGSLDGGMFMILEDGELDSLLVEMAGIDLMESVSLVMRRNLQQSKIRCGYTDIQAANGRLNLKDFIIDTEDSVFLASGNVDLARETVDLKFSPHPRDASYFAATAPLHITGSLADPKVRPGKKLYTRVALAAAMAALTGPAAIVLPFIEMGGGNRKSYCNELFGN